MLNRCDTVYVAKISYNIPLIFSLVGDFDINYTTLLHNPNRIPFYYDEIFQAGHDITSPSNNIPITIEGQETLNYTAGHQITLEDGFNATATGNFIAQIKPDAACQSPGVQSRAFLVQQNNQVPTNLFKLNSIYCYPNPVNSNIILGFSDITMEGAITLEIKNINGQLIQSLAISIQANGEYNYEYNTSGMPAGVYFFTFLCGNKTLTSRFVKLN